MRWLVAALVFLGTFAVIVGVMWAARRGHWSVAAEYLVVVGRSCWGRRWGGSPFGARRLAPVCAGAYYAGMRKPYNMNIESGVIDRLRAEAPEVNRSRLVEQLIVRWLADRGQALGAVSRDGPVPEAVADRAVSAGSLATSASPRASTTGDWACPEPLCLQRGPTRETRCPKHGTLMTVKYGPRSG